MIHRSSKPAHKQNPSKKKTSWENADTNVIMGGAQTTFSSLSYLEHTGHGLYSSDIIQVGAIGALFNMMAQAQANIISSYKSGDEEQVFFDFCMDVRTDQVLNKHLDQVFHKIFPGSGSEKLLRSSK